MEAVLRYVLTYYLIDPTLSVWFATEIPVVAWRALMLLYVLETATLAFLLRVTGMIAIVVERPLTRRVGPKLGESSANPLPCYPGWF